jgi:hypothetical protein
MFHHITLVRLKPEASAAQIDLAIAKLRELPAQVPAIGTYEVARNAGVNPGTFDLAVVASFADLDAYRAYQVHPAHKAAGAEFLLPIGAEFASIQYVG